MKLINYILFIVALVFALLGLILCCALREKDNISIILFIIFVVLSIYTVSIASDNSKCDKLLKLLNIKET